jgi:hypothetical protein
MRTKCAYISLPEDLTALFPQMKIGDEVLGLMENNVLLITEKDTQVRRLNHFLRLMREGKIEVVYVYFGMVGSEDKLRLFNETVQELKATPTASVS